MSPKPWAKVEIGYMRHPKFLALSGNAISLWHEGKDYCDTHHTDGIIPKEAVKTFRFRGAKSIAMLTTSCGPKPDGTPYAPLWEAHMLGYRMHDYLDHNDCRDEILARLEAAEDVAELRKVANRDRQAKFRAERKAKLAALGGRSDGHGPVTESERDRTRDITRTSHTPTATTTTTATTTDPPVSTEQKPEGGAPSAPAPRPMAPIHDRSHRQHAVCGRVCLHAGQFGDFVRRRNHDGADHEVRRWAEGVIGEWTTGRFARTEPGDPFDFWRARYDERWPAAGAEAPSSRRPAWAPKPALRPVQA